MISLIVWGVGIILFLIPAVPGVPIYLCCGVTLVAAGASAGPRARRADAVLVPNPRPRHRGTTL